MKKLQFSFLLAMFATASFCFSCKKGEIISSSDLNYTSDREYYKRNEATWLDSESITRWLLKLKIFLGHTAQQCGGKCMYILGEYGHIDCRGFGDVCNYSVQGLLTYDDESEEFFFTIIGGDDFGHDLDFEFPDRSLFITNPINEKELWLNIPEQILVRESEDEPFELHNIWFSDVQELENK